MMENNAPKPINYDIITQIIPKNSRILDLGCGDGVLLKKLIDEKSAVGTGVEINPGVAIKAIEKGLSVIQGDIDEGLKQFLDGSFDYVVLNQTLQSAEKPDFVIDEMLRVGKKSIVSFPNFAYWKVRFYLFFWGKMPKSKDLPYEWYNTPNIHLLTVNDFYEFCQQRKIKILNKVCISESGKRTNGLFSSLLSSEVIFVIQK